MKILENMETIRTIVEGAMVVKDNEEATLHCSIIGYHLAIWSAVMEK